MSSSFQFPAKTWCVRVVDMVVVDLCRRPVVMLWSVSQVSYTGGGEAGRLSKLTSGLGAVFSIDHIQGHPMAYPLKVPHTRARMGTTDKACVSLANVAIVSCSMVYLLLLLPNHLIPVLGQHVGAMVTILGLGLLFSILDNFWRCTLLVPGYTSMHSERDDGRTCAPCGFNKPSRAHHCSRCNRCVVNLDHHCKWTGNCVHA